jgi:hypothetical protein
MTQEEKTFLSFVRKECKKYGVECLLVNKNSINLPSEDNDTPHLCGGYFDGENKVLACATKRNDWLGLLVHEYCHMTQWVENCKEWKEAEEKSSYTKVFDFLNGTPTKNIRYHLGKCRDLELDNEKRSVALMKKMNLSIDIPTYIKKANAYVMFYNYMWYSKKWCTPETSPYTITSVWENMSPKFNMGYKTMSNKTKKIFDNAYL